MIALYDIRTDNTAKSDRKLQKFKTKKVNLDYFRHAIYLQKFVICINLQLPIVILKNGLFLLYIII